MRTADGTPTGQCKDRVILATYPQPLLLLRRPTLLIWLRWVNPNLRWYFRWFGQTFNKSFRAGQCFRRLNHQILPSLTVSVCSKASASCFCALRNIHSKVANFSFIVRGKAVCTESWQLLLNRVFISYAREDSTSAERLYHDLISVPGDPVAPTDPNEYLPLVTNK